MLHDLKLPKSFWVDAMQMAAYITAHSPESGLHGKSPYEILFKRRVDPTLFCTFGCQAYALIPKDKQQGNQHVIFNEFGKVQKDDSTPWNTDPSTDYWEGLIPENAHYPDQNTLEEDDPNPWIQGPNELQMEPHLQVDILQAMEPYQHEDVLRVVGAPKQLRHPPQQSLQLRPEH
ncbi:hypothetical protein SERLA73DRAFT_69846 [Serpula lacrymans var. lacrymans S7.3]|uniref:Reverse transcriptase Ty1/copia-type domain-containing protein n=2 Tax=Serpula lacrymans var. lacrymans TaxID=341189 RepID=F8PIV5_SERL3|nr:uncharacterized protein SERLADRAFT_433911 [Serpula lacrymans var. lacrymans S7.9]EGO04055.1 hypothetical protein SERLA73DRAFT_69846 [Serpula lacrymans var. lacrymans S7.3]EGO29971.1 hypothetical protein SERLADRAFT_433911 [Serpula lacrymans var. lacrymans S7.9]